MSARLIAEDLALLLQSPETGRPVVGFQELAPALAGALLLELALRERVHVEDGGRWSGDKLRAVPGPATGDDLLDEALGKLPAERSTGARGAVQKIADRRLAGEVHERLAAAGLARRTPGAFLKLGRTHPDVATRKELLASVLAALEAPDASAAEQRPAALVSLLHAVGAVTKVVPAEGAGRKDLKRRAKALSEGEWAGAAVLAAVRAAQSGAAAAVTAATAAAAASG